MPQWIPEEISQIERLVAEIATCGLSRRRVPQELRLDLRLSDGVKLIDGLAGSTRALLVRQLLRALDFDEDRHLQWRVEHKLVQALILRQWAPDLIPVTCGLGALAARYGLEGLRSFLTDSFPNGYVLKAALGDSSGESPERDNANAILATLCFATIPQGILEEKYIVQERVAIATEYRVHTIEEDVIEDLTFRRYEGGSIPGEREPPNAFVSSVLSRLPDGLVGGSLLAWDVVLRPSGDFAIVEVNFSGFHKAFKRGFHCSGYFHDYHWGACDTARLLNHVARTDGIEVTPMPDAASHPLENRFYFETANWQLRHRGLPPVNAPRCIDAPSEDEMIAPVIRQIEAFTGPRRRPPVNGVIELRLSHAIPLLDRLAASTRALMTRQVLRDLGFDERRLTPWRLEHKLVQALIFRYFDPDSLPLTCGLDRLAQGVRPSGLRGLFRQKFPEGFVIKTALGDCSGRDCDSRTEAALSWMESGARTMPHVGMLTDEEFIVQQRKNVRREYRVHTIEDCVIEDLTVHRHEGLVAPGERQGPNRYVQGILDGLPSGITSGAHLGWDVALLDGGGFAVIEVNIGGIHAVYNPGFHASGFFHHKDYGAIYSARLLLFLERIYRCQITVVADAPEYYDECYFYSEVADWKSRF